MAQPYSAPCDAGLINAVPCARAAGTEPDQATKRATLIACVLASSMAFIDGSALTVALPALAAAFGVPTGAVHWVLNGYVLALAALTVIGGALADARGRRNMLVIGCGAFGLASVACALAPSLDILIAARVAQGVAAALLTPASLALIGEVFPEGERNRAIATWAAASALTTAAGPALGGWLTESFGWSSIFWINPPIAVLSMAILFRFRCAGIQRAGAFDWTGALLLALTLLLVAVALSRLTPAEAGGSIATTYWLPTPALAALTLCLAIAWLGQQRVARNPMMPMRMLVRADFSRLNLATLFAYAALSILFFVAPFELIRTRGLSATETGFVFLPFTLSLGFLSRYAGSLADAMGSRPVLMGGLLLAACGFALMSALRASSLTVAVLIPMLIVGLGFALFVAPLTAGVLSSVDRRDTGLASALNNTASRIAQLLGVALAAGLSEVPGGYSLALYMAAGLSVAAALPLLKLSAPGAVRQ